MPYILILLLSTYTHTYGAIGLQEFTSAETCNAALKAITQHAKVDVSGAWCLPK